MIDWILCLIGIMVYFINRYANRTKKTIEFTFNYWLKDNWSELSTTILLNIAIMIIIHMPGTEVSFDELLSNLPFFLKVSAVPTLSFLLGLGLTAFFYKAFKVKTKKINQ